LKAAHSTKDVRNSKLVMARWQSFSAVSGKRACSL